MGDDPQGAKPGVSVESVWGDRSMENAVFERCKDRQGGKTCHYIYLERLSK